jgi:periplasmic protein TonB
MKIKTLHLAAAICVSGGIHLAVAGWFSPEVPETRVAGGAAVDMLILGNAFEDALQAGAPSDSAEPVKEAVTELEPVEQVEEPVETAEIRPVEPEPVVEPEPEAIAEPAETVDAIEAVETAEVEPADPVETASVAPTGELAALPDIPVPTPAPKRPSVEKPAPKKVEKRVEKKQAAKAAPPKPRKTTKSAGAGGKQKANAVKAASGKQTANVSRDAGNARVSNYPGKVASKLRRALRYPREAKRDRLRGTVVVSFTVSQNGSVGGVRVARSSGSSVLDRAAAEAVRRAAPFPAIPAGAGRSNWAFSVPLAFTR